MKSRSRNGCLLRTHVTHALAAALLFALLGGCTTEKADVDYGMYPNDVGKIIVNKCANSGCHNTASKEACDGLDLSSWDKLFEGGNNNSSVIPYAPKQSFLLFAVNTYPDLGPQLPPSMPVNKTPLTREEVELLRDWIAQGAPDRNGFVKFSDNPLRKKVYVANQGCDNIAVFDTRSKLIMRYMDVGNTGNTEAPHDMMVSPDGRSLYISFYTTNIFQKYRTSDGVKTGEVNLTDNSWHSMAISGNSRYALTTHLDADGKVSLIDLETMQLIIKYQGSQLFVYPHGCTMNYSGTLAYITSQQGNFLYKVDLTDPFNADINQVPLQTGDVPQTMGIYKPYEVDFSPDYSKYYVTCQGTNEVRVFKSSNDSLLQVIPTSGVPQTMAFSHTMPYMFVACMEDSANASTTSAINVINTQSNTLVATIFSGYQPRGLCVDDQDGYVYVANRNIQAVGWAPHHTTECAGRNGYITLIDMRTLQLVPGWKTEVGVDPYSVAIIP